MTKYFGVDWAPVWVPFERRLQTAVVAIYCATFLVFPTLCLVTCIFLLFTPLFFLAAAYLAWMLYDVGFQHTSSRGGRRWPWFRRLFLWRYFRDYFPVELVKTSELTPEKNYIFGYHPHGILSCGAICNFGTEATGFSDIFPGLTPHLMTLKENFKLPFLRGPLLWQGVCDVSKESIQWILTKKGTGNAAVIVVGGAEESLQAKPGTYTLTLLNRKGFVKQAIRAGASLVPIFSFGENDLFQQADNPTGSRLRKFQEVFKEMMGVAPPVFYGRGVFNYTFGLLPYRLPVHTVVGRPIEVTKCNEPTQEMIDEYHKMYMGDLKKLFDEYKVKYGISENKHLQFV